MTDNETTRGKKKMEQDQMGKEHTNRKDTKYMKCGSPSGGIYTELMQQ